MSFWAQNITYLRKALGWLDRNSEYSQSEFAEIIGTSRQSIVRWDSGSIPSTPQLTRLAKFFSQRLESDITPEDLLETDLRGLLQIRPLPKRFLQLPEEKRKILMKIDGMIFRNGEKVTLQDLETLADVFSKYLEKEKE